VMTKHIADHVVRSEFVADFHDHIHVWVYLVNGVSKIVC
jgi:hypothetical protein